MNQSQLVLYYITECLHVCIRTLSLFSNAKHCDSQLNCIVNPKVIHLINTEKKRKTGYNFPSLGKKETSI